MRVVGVGGLLCVCCVGKLVVAFCFVTRIEFVVDLVVIDELLTGGFVSRLF